MINGKGSGPVGEGGHQGEDSRRELTAHELRNERHVDFDPTKSDEDSIERDKDGRIVKVTEGIKCYTNFGGGEKKWGDVPQTREYAYDAEGRRVKETLDNPYVSQEKEWKYDSKGNVVASRVLGHDRLNYYNTPVGWSEESVKTEYDDSQRPIAQSREERYSGNYSDTQYKYDEEGRLVEEMVDDANGKSRYQHEYSDDGELLRIQCFELHDDEGKEEPEEVRGPVYLEQGDGTWDWVSSEQSE